MDELEIRDRYHDTLCVNIVADGIVEFRGSVGCGDSVIEMRKDDVVRLRDWLNEWLEQQRA